MTFQEWFNSAPHRAKYSSDHPAYLAAQEAWEAAHEACAKVCDAKYEEYPDEENDLAFALSAKELAVKIRARGQA